MRAFTFILRRNLSLFLNNKMNILLSFASIPIVIGLYVLFLRDFLLELMAGTGLQAGLVDEFTDRLMMAGLLVVINTTTCFGIIQVCVNDAAVGIKRDYLAAPISPYILTMGYWAASVGVSAFFTSLTAAGGELFFYTRYGTVLSLLPGVKAIGMILFSSGINSAILLCFAIGIKNTTTFSTFANLYGTLIGFLAGAYLPGYFYPEWLRPILFFFPPAQSTSIMRKLYLHDLLPSVFQGQPEQLRAEFLLNFGVSMQLNGVTYPVGRQLLNLAVSLLVLMLCLWLFPWKRSKPRSVKMQENDG